MARADDPTPRAQRLTPLVTVSALAAATALAFGRVFQGRTPTLALIAAGLLAVALGWATRRRGLALATLASLLGLALALTWLVFPQTAWYGLPTSRTLRAVGRSIEYVGRQTRNQVAPAPPLAPLMLAAITAVWAASSSAYTLAVRAGSPLLAVLPPVALVGFADIVLEDGVRPVYAVLFLLAALAVVFSDGLRRIHQWGPVWSGRYEGRALRSATGRSLRRVALVAVAAALLVPGLLPGFRSKALIDFSGSGSSAVRLDPFVSIHASLQREEPVDLFRVTSATPSYWRLFALDQFDGSTWEMSDPGLQDAQEYGTPARFPGAFPGGSTPVEERFRILTDLGDRWIPMAYPAESLTFGDGGVRYDATLGVAQAPYPLQEGTEYEVISRRVLPTPEQLDAVTFGSPAQYGRYTFLPGDVPPKVKEVALRWAGEEPTPYRQVFAIAQHFHDGDFTYSQDVEPTADAQALVRFLTQTRTGFCQQYATAMAVLVRELGYPARVAVGYRPGTSDEGVYTVRSDDAHAWVEVLFPGYGWLPFEPTPGPFGNPLAQPGTYLNPTAPTEGGGGQAGQGSEAGGGQDAATGGLPPKIQSIEFQGSRRGGGARPFDLPSLPAPQPKEPGYSIPYRWLLGLLLLALVVLAIAIPLVKSLWRRRSLHRRQEPRRRVLAAYRVFDGEATDLGLGRHAGETLAEYRGRLTEQVAFSDGHLATLTRVTERAAYAAEPMRPEEADAAVRATRTAIRDMRRSTGLLRRMTGIFRPGL